MRIVDDAAGGEDRAGNLLALQCLLCKLLMMNDLELHQADTDNPGPEENATDD